MLAIIPARGGSKGVPRKNLAMLAGSPMIAWTCRAALASNLIGRVVVSTDDAEIAEAARQAGVEVPFLRPAALATDEAPMIDTVLHGLGWLADREGYRPDAVALLQPTSPLRTATDLDAGLSILFERSVDGVIAVTPVPSHMNPVSCYRDSDGRLKPFLADLADRPLRKQDKPPAFAPNGALYAVRRHCLDHRPTLFPDKLAAYRMPAERSIDVETAFDLFVADAVLRSWSGDLDGAPSEPGLKPPASCLD